VIAGGSLTVGVCLIRIAKKGPLMLPAETPAGVESGVV
jgi:hypothetical protein